MTVSTKARHTSGFARFAGLAVIIGGLFAFQATVRGSQVTSIDVDLHAIATATVSELAAGDGNEGADIHASPQAPHRLLIPQTETKRKPDLFVPVVQQAVNAPVESPIDETKLDPADIPALEKMHDPSWRPLDKLPRESRFLKDDPVKSDQENGLSEKFHWKPAILQSVVIQSFQLSYALVIQEKTRKALKGKFFDDYWESLKGVRGWDDGK